MEFYYCAAFEKKKLPKSKLSSNDSMKIGSIYRHLYGYWVVDYCHTATQTSFCKSDVFQKKISH